MEKAREYLETLKAFQDDDYIELGEGEFALLKQLLKELDEKTI